MSHKWLQKQTWLYDQWGVKLPHLEELPPDVFWHQDSLCITYCFIIERQSTSFATKTLGRSLASDACLPFFRPALTSFTLIQVLHEYLLWSLGLVLIISAFLSMRRCLGSRQLPGSQDQFYCQPLSSVSGQHIQPLHNLYRFLSLQPETFLKQKQ